ncbi:hypothetical protein AJ80_04143 [Polytolypa hystricis UAMH7299]|uniref:HECT-type E3 ubiquitin transferase n=1 Tax=Polytolypa hystricis (strain UAMH7299) TaxID=1447883 RepID=A0A2B7Y4U4_POLH7|nr:hypothetical protein AJ80_04143 [Polytolypa hystricis UAMH7299]
MPSWTARLLASSASAASKSNSRDDVVPQASDSNLESARTSNPLAIAPSSRRSHLRSVSQPFPSLFASRKRTDQLAGGESFPDRFSDEATHGERLSRSVSPQKQPARAPPPEEQISCRCMTCDHTNVLPRGRRGFRCGKCTTMNDLVPYYYSQSLHIPLSDTEHRLAPAQEKVPVLPVSVERTRKIIDRCLASYLQSYLDEQDVGDGSPSRSPPAPHKRGAFESHRRSQSYSLSHSDTKTSSPLVGNEMPPLVEPSPTRSRVSPDGKLTAPQNNALSQPLPPLSVESDLRGNAPRELEALPGRDMRRTISRTTPEAEARGGVIQSTSIFRPLEDYIIMSFNGCDTLNHSFLTVKPHPARVGSEGDQPLAPYFSSAPVSRLDEKTILLSDVAENGSWWTGNKPHGDRTSEDQTRDKAHEFGRGLVSSKTPRISWSELADWYQLIIHAGESWQDQWNKMKPNGADGLEHTLRANRWDSIKLPTLEQEISGSQQHLRVVLLRASESLLQRPRCPLKRPEDTRFLLILLANPLLYSHGVGRKQSSKLTVVSSPSDPPHPKDPPGAEGPDRSPSQTRPRSTSIATDDSGRRSLIIKRIIGLLSNLPPECHHLLISWFSRFSESHFRRIVELVGSFISYRLTRERKRRRSRVLKPGDDLNEFIPTFSSTGSATPAQLHSALRRDNSSRVPSGDSSAVSYGEDWQIRAAARVMALLFSANNMASTRRRDVIQSTSGLGQRNDIRCRRPLLPISAFYSTMLDYSDLVADFEAWESRRGKFSFCQYPFFLSIWAKIHIMEHDARRKMEEKAREAFFDSILGRRGVSQYLVLKVRRDCLVEDSLRGVSEVVGTGQDDIKKGLRIEFLGEEGVDAGGLRKEWFLLLVREVFDPLHGLFIYDEDSQYCYFNPYCLESSEQFFLVGVVLGLAIYNSTILDVALPPFAFRKLLASAPPSNVPTTSTARQTFRPNLDDLAEYRPALAKGLRQLLDYDGNVEEAFCCDFAVQTERYGEHVEVPLHPGGEDRPVTNENRREYVDLYVKYILDKSVSRQFEPFKRGFFTVCGGNALHLFHPEEIELLVRGSDDPLDIPSLRAVAIYEHWQIENPDREPVVNWFWDFFANATPENQRRILSFITGSDRIPAMGTTNLIIRLVCLGQDTDRFPTARTCFNMVALYRYKSRRKLEEKLWRAVVDSEGFGLK